LLRWLYELSAPGQPDALLSSFWLSNYIRFLRTDYDFFKLNEVEAAVRWLDARGYLTRAATSDGSTQVLTMTEKGERLVESGRSTNKDEHPTGSTHITIRDSSGINVANQSSHVAQTATVSMTREGREVINNMADLLEGSAAQSGVSAVELERVPALVAELRAAAAEPAVQQSKLRELLDVVKQLAIGAAAAGPLAIGLNALVYQAIQVLGLG
jgi:DNA-binding MarR family transcriptional regulator